MPDEYTVSLPMATIVHGHQFQTFRERIEIPIRE